MKEFQDVLNEIKFGSVLFIDSINNDSYNGYIREYDGDIFLDIKTVKVENVIESNPNIKKLLDNDYIFQIAYDYENRKYISSIYKGEFNISKKNIDIEEDTIYYQTSSSTMIDSIIELDTMIINMNKNQLPKVKKQIYA